jgi:hypothetical protein
MIGPAIVLSGLLGNFNTSIYVLIRGTAGGRLPLVALAAILGAWAGDAVGSRLDLDPLLIGDYHVVSATLFAWLGIGAVALLSNLGPSRPRP